MSPITTTKKDVIWNFIGTIVSMISGFFLLPLLMKFLTSDELGLWYVFIAVSNLAMLFEFGFNPSFARNIVYVVSGARKLTKEGCDFDSVQEGVDWRLLKTVFKTSKIVYALIAIVVLLFLLTIGSIYINLVAGDLEPFSCWGSWIVFCVSVFLNLYFLYTITQLRGVGDIAGENQAKTLSRLAQLLVSAILLMMGAGLFGASLGYLANGLVLRIYASFRLKSHGGVIDGIKSVQTRIGFTEIKSVLVTIAHVAWRDGFVQIACYASTQAMSLVGSFTLGLAETGTYSVLMQFSNAVYSFASAYPMSFMPSFQSAHASHDILRQREIVSRGLAAYILLFLLGTAGVVIAAFPLLPLIKPDFTPNAPLFLGLCLYLLLWNQHSICCNYIVGTNEIPYLVAYAIAAVLGVVFSYLFSGIVGLGAWGLVLGQALSQLIYNNWRWPMYLARKIGTTYTSLLKSGISYWGNCLFTLLVNLMSQKGVSK